MLTHELMRHYDADSSLCQDWVSEALDRRIHLREAEIAAALHGKTVLVTGGSGCVGKSLIGELRRLGAARIVSVDKARAAADAEGPAAGFQAYTEDIQNREGLRAIFEREKPRIVFHLAAVRLPWEAQQNARETVLTNCLGTRNVAELCEAHGVERCVYSSTGKTSKYTTAGVYTGSKKIAEWLLADRATDGKTLYHFVRFTHILENSSVCAQFDEKIGRNEPVNVHAPNRFIVVQNTREAAHLLLNGLTQARAKTCRFTVSRHLGWPVETLWLAVHKIRRSGKNLPVYFEGVPEGYGESFFRGQFDWSDPCEVNSLFNALESARRETDPSGTMTITELAPFSAETFRAEWKRLEALALDPASSEDGIKKAVAGAVFAVARTTFDATPAEKILQILDWGLSPKQNHPEENDLTEWTAMLRLIAEGLKEKLRKEHFESVNMRAETWETIVDSLAAIPSLRDAAAALRRIRPAASH